MTGYLRIIWSVFTRPDTFFDSVKKETGYVRLMLFFAVSFIIAQIVSWLLAIPLYTDFPFAFAIASFFVSMLFSLIAAFAGPFVGSGIVHLGVLIVGGKKGYYNTYKAVTYSAFVGLIYSVFLSVVNFVLYFIDPFTFNPMNLSYPLSLLFFINLFFVLVSLVHVVVVQVIGVSKLQEIGKGMSFISSFVIPLAIFIILSVIIALFLAFVSYLFFGF